MFGNREQMRLEFAQRHRRMHRRAVIQHVQVALLKIHDALPLGILDIGVSNIPFFGHGPVEELRFPSALQRSAAESASGSWPESAGSVAGDASADRIKLRREAVQLLADFGRVSLIEFLQQAH